MAEDSGSGFGLHDDDRVRRLERGRGGLLDAILEGRQMVEIQFPRIPARGISRGRGQWGGRVQRGDDVQGES
jgi:hypothetical protein